MPLLDSGEQGARGLAEAMEAAFGAEGIGSGDGLGLLSVDETSPQVLLGCASERMFAVGANAATATATFAGRPSGQDGGPGDRWGGWFWARTASGIHRSLAEG